MLDLLAIVPYYTAALCASLAKLGGIRVQPASITYHHDPDCFVRLGVKTDAGLLNLAWKSPARLRRMLKLAEYLLNLSAYLARFTWSRPDAVHVQFLPLLERRIALELWFVRVIKACGIKVIYTVHNLLPHADGERFRELYARVYKLADHLICHDNTSAARLSTEFGVPAGRLSVIPHGPLLEPERHSDSGHARARLGVNPDSCVVLWQGILRPYKGLSFLLEAWREVCASEGRATLLVAGSGDPEETRVIETQIDKMGLRARVHTEFRFISLEALEDYFTAADVLVYPYSQITTSGALMTGIVRGKAIVATTLPVFERVLADGVTGLLVPYGDVRALSRALLRVIQDSELRARLAEKLTNAQARLPRWPDIAFETWNCYRRVLSGPPAMICAKHISL
jgi:glycosyltransferase involved in cell wall biosynthesis